MTLYIDTTDINQISFALEENKSLKKFVGKIGAQEGHKILPLLEKFLKVNKTSGQLSSIIVNSGPGSFTGIRVGIALAQGLGLGLEAKVKALPNEKYVKLLKKFN